MNALVNVFSVQTVADVQEAVNSGVVVVPRGGGSKPALSTPTEEVSLLDLGRLTGIVEYEPGEFTITAKAGTTLAEITAVLEKNGQYLPFDPPLVQSGATIGGTIAAGLSGPGRYRYGGVRDFLIGVRFIDGLGRLVRGGGKVVKNAAGFDLPKLMVGSLGRLGILVEASMKVFPRPPAYTTLQADYPTLADALRGIYTLAMGPYDIEALDLTSGERSASRATLWVRLGGLEEALPARVERLRSVLGVGVPVESSSEAKLWQDMTEFRWIQDGWSLVKAPTTPARILSLDQHLAETGAVRRYSVGGNVVWMASSLTSAALDAMCAAQGISALRVRGASGSPWIGVRESNVFGQRIKKALDPNGRFLEL